MNGNGSPVYRPGAGRPKTFDQHVQDIASASHKRGVVLTRADAVVGRLEAAAVCRTLRAAHENTRGEEGRHGHVKNIACAIAVRLGVQGAVQVSRYHWNLLTGYAAAQRKRAVQ